MFEILASILHIVWLIFKTWWWIIPPFLLIRPAIFLWLWWKQELNWKDRKYLLLEVKLPKETLKPIKAMEDVCSTFYMIANDRDPGNFREKWIEGDTTFYPSLSLEIVSIDGEPHFYIRTEDIYRDPLESAIYAQYPDVEIAEVDDYAKYVPQDIPNKEWMIEGREWILGEKNCYPIKTYEEFETGTEPLEEKRVDPLAKLLEALSNLSKGEQVWIQMLLGEPGDRWINDGKAIRDKLVKRPEHPPVKPMIQEAAELLIKGAPEEEKKEEKKELIPPEMMLTPGEREIVRAIEKKISKQGFETIVRVLYLGKSDVFFKPHLGLPSSFVVNFNTRNLNYFKVSKKTTTKVKSTLLWYLDERRAFLRKRKMFRNYVYRLPPLFPQKGGTCVLNTEELATIFHFPSRIVAPAPLVSRVEAKKGEAPLELPVE